MNSSVRNQYKNFGYAAGFMAIALYSVHSNVPAEAHASVVDVERQPSYEPVATIPSNFNLEVSLSSFKHETIEERMSNFFGKFASEQVELGADFEAALMKNLASLYEI